MTDNEDDEPTRALLEEVSLSDIQAQPAPAQAGARGAAYVGRYELLVELASGGMATVYVGRQRGAGGFERLVAIKRMHRHISAVPELAASFMDEARIASLIRHPNVVNVHDVHEADGEHLLVMDYVDGTSLAHVMRAARQRKTKVPRPAALRILVDALYGLHAAHEQESLEGKPLGVVHRDATPHNILLGTDGTARLTDFGIAKAAERTVHTGTGLAKGKFRYMAPEQARAGALDRRVDVFAIGIVAWELLTGERLFKGESDVEVLLTVSEGNYPRPSRFDSTVPAPLEGIVMRALSVDPNQRWPTAKAFAEALEGYARESGDLCSPSEVARLVDEFCGAEIRERRLLISEVLSGKRPPVMSTGSVTPSHAGTGSTGAQPLTLDSVKVVPAISEEELRRYRWRRRLLIAIAVAGTAMVAALVVLVVQSRGSTPEKRMASATPAASASTAAAGPAASAEARPDRVRIQLSSDTDIAEIRAPGISDITFNTDGAAFELPRSDKEVAVNIRFDDKSVITESIVPRENTAIRVRSVAGAHSAESAPKRPTHQGASRAAHHGGGEKTPAGLEKNPYE